MFPLNVEGKQNSLFPGGPVINYFIMPEPNSKLIRKQNAKKKLFARQRLAQQICCRFKLHDLIMCELNVVVSLGN